MITNIEVGHIYRYGHLKGGVVRVIGIIGNIIKYEWSLPSGTWDVGFYGMDSMINFLNAQCGIECIQKSKKECTFEIDGTIILEEYISYYEI